MSSVRQERIKVLCGTIYKHIISGNRHFYLYQGREREEEKEEKEEQKPVEVKRRKYEVGDINKYGEMKVNTTGDSKLDWVYVGKQGKDHPKVKHLFE